MPLKVKLRSSGKKLTPYVSEVKTSGRVQKAFAEQIGHKVGACVASKVTKGMKISDIKNAVRECAKQARGTKLSL